MTKAEISTRLSRLALAIAQIKSERDDSGPRMILCATPGCKRLTRSKFCLECENQRERKKQP
jgi:hypothetical protein